MNAEQYAAYLEMNQACREWEDDYCQEGSSQRYYCTAMNAYYSLMGWR